MTRRNIGIAKSILDGVSLAQAAAENNLSRGRCWQITRAFCLEFFLHHQLYDGAGNLRDLEGLRYKWRTMLMV